MTRAILKPEHFDTRMNKVEARLAGAFSQVAEPIRASQDIARQIGRSIEEGTLRNSDQLPGERRLAAMFGVSRAPVREALRLLEALGYVTVRARRGATVQVVSPEDDALIRMRFESDHEKLVEHFQVHSALFAEACAQSARHSRQEAVEVLERILVQQEQAQQQDEKTDLFYADREFTCAIAGMAQNRTLETMLVDSTMYTRSCRITLFAIANSDRASRSLTEHRLILERIRGGNENQACLAGRAHVMSALAEWLEFVDAGTVVQ